MNNMKRLVKTFENFQMDQFEPMGVEHQAHHEAENYMFFGDLETIKRCVDQLLEMDPAQVDQILKNGHNWAVDHVVSSKDDIEEVYNFLVNEVSEPASQKMEMEIQEESSSTYQCNECNMTYEAHEVTEEMTCECGGMVKPVYEKW